MDIDTLLIPLGTEHLEESPENFDKILLQTIGFTGTAGYLVIYIKNDKIQIYFMTDERYAIASEEMATRLKSERNLEIDLRIEKTGERYNDIIKSICGKRIGVNFKRMPIVDYVDLIDRLKISSVKMCEVIEKDRIEPKSLFEFLKNINNNFMESETENILVHVDLFKAAQRPKQKAFSIEVPLELKVLEKDLIKNISQSLQDQESEKASGKIIPGITYAEKFQKLFGEDNETIVTCAIHEINYSLNIRTEDASTDPHVYAFMIATRDKAIIFCDSDISGIFKQETPKIIVKSYNSFYTELQKFIENKTNKILLSSPNAFMLNMLDSNIENIKEMSKKHLTAKIENMMDVKNKCELQGFVQSGINHAKALIKLFVFLEELAKVNGAITEKEAGNKLLELCKEDPDFLMFSFEPIVGSGANGASIHHRASGSPVQWNKLFLIDSGIQNKYGTTDITRTLLFNTDNVPSEELKMYINEFTTVLRGQINGKMVRTRPAHFRGMVLSVPRYIMNLETYNDDVMDYGHSGSHGVAHSGNVHETSKFVEGSVFSIEPGHYVKGSHGIRIEDVCTAQKVSDSSTALQCVELTFVPYQLDLIDVDKLLPAEKKYLIRYCELCRNLMSPFLEGAELDWLMRQTDVSIFGTN